MMDNIAHNSASDRRMPTYYFDIEDDSRLQRDDTGVVCENEEAVRRTAVEALPDIASDGFSDAGGHTIAILVRNEEGHYVFRAAMTLTADWLR
ncbi:DUF6894 family protein [Fulvimarina pelagi]|nr:hypothetical protein [Fulvimarina pelagi]